MQIPNGPTNLNLVVDGDTSAPPVLFLHGITMSTATWQFVVPSLAERYRVWRLDFRGHGDSDRAPDSYTPAGYVSDAVAAIESGVGQPCVVVGHSLGGLAAAALAQQRPDLVRAVLLEDPALFDTGSGSESAADAMEGNALLDLFRLMYEAIPKVQEEGIAEHELAGMLAAGPSASGPPAGELYHPDTFDGWARSQLRLDVEVLKPVINPTAIDASLFATGVFDPDLPIKVPGLALAGDPASPDTVLRAPMIEHLSSTSPDLRTEIVSGAGHMIHDELDSRDGFTAALTTLLAEHAA